MAKRTNNGFRTFGFVCLQTENESGRKAWKEIDMDDRDMLEVANQVYRMIGRGAYIVDWDFGDEAGREDGDVLVTTPSGKERTFRSGEKFITFVMNHYGFDESTNKDYAGVWADANYIDAE